MGKTQDVTLEALGWEVKQDGWLWNTWRTATKRVPTAKGLVEVVVTEQGVVARLGEDREVQLMEGNGTLTYWGHMMLWAKEAAEIAYTLAAIQRG